MDLKTRFMRKKIEEKLEKSTITEDNLYFLQFFFIYEFLATFMSKYNLRWKFTAEKGRYTFS